MKSFSQLLALLAAVFIMAAGCRKENNFTTTSAQLRFDADTIFLDTVFTGIGSSTRILKVYNPTNENIYINRVRLGRGQNSYFRMNVNGESGRDIKNVELAGDDSIYVFIEVTADVLNANELLYTDSIVFETDNNQQHINLVTLAKDAYFHYPTDYFTIEQPAPYPDIQVPYSVLPPNATWGTDKPHVVYGYVVVDENRELNILAGAEVHFHSGSGLWVYEGGTLKIDAALQGDMNSNPVIIQGDRLEPWYEDIPGQWGGVLGGIFIQSGSSGNVINNTIIKNATTALRVDSTADANPNLALHNVQLLNNSRVGLYCGYANVEADNTIIANSGVHLFYGLGGTYNFRHCTFANYWTSSTRNTAALALTNFFEDNAGNVYTRDVNQAYFANCIIYGSAFNEVSLGINQGGLFDYQFKNALLRIDENPDAMHYDVNDATRFTDCILNLSPEFVDQQINDYALDSISPALDAANSLDANLVPFDIFGMDRTIAPDMGAIER